MREVIVNELMFIHAFERDEVFGDPCSQSAFIGLETGGVIWVFEEDDDAEMSGDDCEEEDEEPPTPRRAAAWRAPTSSRGGMK